MACALPTHDGVVGTRTTLAIVLVVAGLTSACAMGTRTGRLGQLGADANLVTLVVSEDADVVRHECPLVVATGRVLGCQTSQRVDLPTGAVARAVRIVRYTDQLPSALAFEIDLHELCHAVATVQGLDDPCHTGNGGFAQTPYAAPHALFGR